MKVQVLIKIAPLKMFMILKFYKGMREGVHYTFNPPTSLDIKNKII